MITQGPFNLTLNQTLPLVDPGANSNHPATAVQVQNASPFIVNVNAGGVVFTIQSFTAQTVPFGQIGGQPLGITPIETNSSGLTTSVASLTVVWLLAGESSPMIDGSLTAAAITSGLEGQGIAGASGGLQVVNSALLAGLNNMLMGDAVTPSFQIWGWGLTHGPGALPTTGGFSLYVRLVGGGQGYVDTIAAQGEYASSRVDGLFVANSGSPALPVVVLDNMTAATPAGFLLYTAQ